MSGEADGADNKEGAEVRIVRDWRGLGEWQRANSEVGPYNDQDTPSALGNAQREVM